MKVIKKLALLISLLLILSNFVYGEQLSPPSEAYTACKGKSDGDASQLTGPRGGTVSGICKKVDGKLVLQPDRLKGKVDGKRGGGPPPEAYTACKGKSDGDASQLTGPRGGTVSGICRKIEGKLVLQPNL
jgi:hypothetical protein